MMSQIQFIDLEDRVICPTCNGYGRLLLPIRLEEPVKSEDGKSYIYTVISGFVLCTRCQGLGYTGKPELID